ncbi:ATP-binding protein [Marinobacter sp.]|uniref:ATP-binding protein n=1 Tax=Marinobacter sp. TaxID=50741 RepID=UPI001B750B32|nr:ATP-binding protein [Marinobacter sp.]MBQ0832937.1 ATP-binding protein [Marinobacter sp.]
MTTNDTSAASTELTGGSGFTYEDTVVAHYLGALLCQDHAPGLDGKVVSVAVQREGHDQPMDDIVVEFQDTVGKRVMGLQAKRSLTISKAASNKDFRKIIAAAVATRASKGFQKTRDAYGFVAEHTGDQRLRSLNRLITWANSSPDGADFDRRFADGGTAGAAEISMRADLKSLTEIHSADAEADFYRHFVALKLEGLVEGGPRRAEVINRLQGLVAANEDGLETLLFDRLCRIAREGAGSSHKWTREGLLNQLRGTVRLRTAPSFSRDVAALLSFSDEGLREVSETIDDFHVERPALQYEIIRRLDSYRLVNITGQPGCGKSAVLKHYTSNAAENGPILFLKSDRLVGKGWSTFASALGLEHSAEELLAEIGATGTPVLFIDGIDRIPPDQKGIITDLLGTIETNADLKHWKVLATSRDQGLEPYRAWFPSSFYKETGIGDVLVSSFSDEEAEALANEKPHLRRLLFGTPAIIEISRRPFFASILAQNLFADTAAPQTEIDLINAWWARAGHDSLPADRAPRQRALLDLAEAGVKRLGKAIPMRRLKESTFSQIGGLEGDKVVREDNLGGTYSFTHDIFFEWAFFRLLIELDRDWPAALSAAGEPPLLGRVVGLLSQSSLITPGRWTEGYHNMEARQLRPQWRREWLTAPPFSPAFPQAIEEFDALLAQDDELFEKVLVWFQAQHTLPNPIILQNAGEVADGIDNIRTADLLGWPSDFLGWGRLLDWLIPKAPSLSARLIPHTLEVFEVWQNALADQRNSRSAAIIKQCSDWLIDLDRLKYSDHKPDQKDKWNALGRESHSTLLSGLRAITLRAARSYPEPARALYVRAVSNKRMREACYSDLMTFTPIMAEVDAELVVAVAKAELIEELPQDRLDREEREYREHSDWLASLRGKKKSELTDKERRILDSPHMFIPIGSRQPDLDDIGIDRHLNYYYPPSPLHEPFASLFRLKPSVALALVRDLSNHAVRGWRQVHFINPRLSGTPLPVTLTFPWGQQEFWGDWHVYSWSMGQLAPQPLECAFLALSFWAFQELDKGRPASEIIQAILEGSECYAMLGIALMLALETLEVSETTLPVVSCQRLWHHDIARLVQEPTRNLDLFGFGSLTRLSETKAEANEYLEKRKYRAREVRQLAMMFALSHDEPLRKRFESALVEFPDALPFEFEEQRSSERVITELSERATAWAGLGDRTNYRQSSAEGDGVQISYQSPVSLTQEQEQRLNDTTAYLQEQQALAWAMKSLSENQAAEGWTLSDAVTFARERDNDGMFETRLEVGPHSAQSAVSAISACVIAFESNSSSDIEWAWDVMWRVMQMAEPERFPGSKIPWHPALHSIAALCRDRQSASPRSDSVERLFYLTAHPLEDIVKTAFQALFLDQDEHVRWTTAQRALDLSLHYEVVIDKDGQRDASAGRAADEQSLENALARIPATTDDPLTDVPAAWVHTAVRQGRRSWRSDDENWGDPDPSFNPQFAAKIFGLFPIEAWCQSDGHRELIKTTLRQLVTWTGERLMPSWREGGGRSDRQPDMYEWNSVLGRLLARAMPHLDRAWFRENLLQPFLADRDEALHVLSAFADGVVTRHVMDAAEIPSGTLELLGDCVERIIRDRQLAPGSYRGGEVTGHELPTLIKALLFVATDQNCPGSVRFANGDWSELGTVMPLVTRLVSAVGWSSYIMGRFLTLCERAGTAYPLDAFSAQANAALEGLANAKGSWVGTMLPARMSGVVQRLADCNYPLRSDQAQGLLRILDTLVDLGDRRSAALEQSEAFRRVQSSNTTKINPTT